MPEGRAKHERVACCRAAMLSWEPRVPTTRVGHTIPTLTPEREQPLAKAANA
jgi:hypothetical protein